MAPIVIYPKPTKTLGLVLLGAGFTAAGVAFAVWRQDLGLPLVAVITTSYLGVPFFAFATLYGLYRLAHPKPALIIDAEGITDHTSAVGVGLVRWQEIDRMYVHAIMGQQMLGIATNDDAALLARQNPFKRWLLMLNRGISPALVNIPESLLPFTIEELLKQVQAAQLARP